jgi:hypothetical protein
MAAVWVRARTIIEQPDAAASADLYRKQFPRFEEAYEALKWLLSRRCDTLGLNRVVGEMEYRLYRQDSDIAARTPSLIVVFSYTEHEVTIDGLKAEPPAGS